jgi:hypothetical protein
VEPTSPGLWAWLHPAAAAATLVLCFTVLRQGLAQRRQRLRRVPAPAGSLKRHVGLGPWAVGLFLASLVGGVGSAVLLRGWAPLATWHGRLALVTGALFAAVWALGRRLVGQQRQLAGVHGALGLVAVLLGGLVAVMGITLLP